MDFVKTLFELLKSYYLMTQDLADKHVLVLPTDLPGSIYTAQEHCRGVFDFRQPVWVDSGRRYVDVGGRAITQSFMRPLLVVFLLESMKGFLLLAQVGFWG